MGQLNRSSIVCLLALTLLGLPLMSSAQSRAPILDKIARAYGVDSFGQVDAIRYTWSASFPGVTVSHTWEWEPKTGKVSYEGKDKDGKPVKATYIESQLAGAPDSVKNEIAPGFVNDNYWAIFVFHAYWDKSATVTDDGMRKLPIGPGTARHVVVKYPQEAGGYTPGDTWELYVGPDNRVKEFVYRRGGTKKPSVVIATWAGNKKAGPILFSTDHRGTADGAPLRVTLSDVAVRLNGSNAWTKAQ